MYHILPLEDIGPAQARDPFRNLSIMLCPYQEGDI